VYIRAAPGRFAGYIQPDMPIGQAHDTHELTFALHFSTANTRSLRNMLCHRMIVSAGKFAVASVCLAVVLSHSAAARGLTQSRGPYSLDLFVKFQEVFTTARLVLFLGDDDAACFVEDQGAIFAFALLLAALAF
jgi:hypothetical protein